MYDNVSHGHSARFYPRLSRRELLIGLLAAIVALDVGLLYLDDPGGPLNLTVDRITAVTWAADGSRLSSGPGLAAEPGTQIRLILQDTNCFLECSLINFTTVIPSPASFTVVSASLPAIPPGDVGNLTVTVHTPPAAYSGPLTLTLS